VTDVNVKYEGGIMIVKVTLCHTNIVLHIKIYIITLYTAVKPLKDRYMAS